MTGDITLTVTAQDKPAVSAVMAKMALTKEPVTNCPKGFVAACSATSRASIRAVSVIQRIFRFIIDRLFPFSLYLPAVFPGWQR